MAQHKQAHFSNIVPSLAHHGNPEQQKTAEELVEAIGTSHDILMRAKTVFPFTLFPTTISVDRTKISITERDFFKIGEVLSIRIEDVLNVTATVGPILGSIKIATRFFNPEKPYVVDMLHRSDALKFKRIVQGYLIARQQEIDCSTLPTKELAKMLDELGKVAPEDKV
jgi:hypothetical protein